MRHLAPPFVFVTTTNDHPQALQRTTSVHVAPARRDERDVGADDAPFPRARGGRRPASSLLPPARADDKIARLARGVHG